MALAYSGDAPRQRGVSGPETPATGSEAGTGGDSIRLVCPFDEISGIGPARKRALSHAFGSTKAVARAGLAGLEKTPGLNAATAKLVYDCFHEAGGG